jgi:hypothetical protein
MKIRLATLLLSTLLLNTACSKNNNQSTSSNSATPETTTSNQNDLIKDIQASIELNGKTELLNFINQHTEVMYRTTNPYTVEIENLKHIETVKDNNTEIFNWDITLTDPNTGYSFKCEGEEVSKSPNKEELGIGLSESCLNNFFSDSEQNLQSTEQPVPTVSPVRINFLTNQSWDHMSDLKVQSTVDSVTITGVKINRGNCSVNKIEPNQLLHIPLAFSASRTFTLYCNPRDILEVEITTDQGVWTFKP